MDKSAITILMKQLMEAEQGDQFSMALSQLTQTLEATSEKLGTLSVAEQKAFIQQTQAELNQLSSERSLQVQQAFWDGLERQDSNIGN